MNDPSRADSSDLPDQPTPEREASDDGAGQEVQDRKEQDQVIVLPPPKDDDPTWRSPWRGPGGRTPPWWALVPLLLLAAYGLYEAGQQGWFELGGQAEARPEVAGERTAAAERAAAERRFRETADSLEDALDGYGIRRSDFELNRIDCSFLAEGYRRVDRRFVSLSIVVRERADRLGGGARDRYEELSGRVDEVNRHFDGSGCRTAG